MNEISAGPIGRIGRFTATHGRIVAISWLVVALGLGALAPRVETALSGAGWEASGSQSVQARRLIDQHFGGLSSYALTAVIHARTQTSAGPEFRRVVSSVERTLKASPAVATVVAPVAGASISRDHHTVLVQAGAASSPSGMVKATDSL